MMTHTFVLCAYKESPYLEKCIDSLIKQTIKSEIIIATSTPNDFIKNISAKYNLKLFSHDDGGIGKDWNFGLSCVTTKYATIAHQDDIYLPEYASKCISALEQAPHSLISFCDYQELKDGVVLGKSINLKVKNILLFPVKFFKTSKFMRKRALSLGCPICCPAVTYNMDNLNNFTFSREMTVSLDWEAWYRIANMNGQFCYVDDVLMYHRIHELSETTNAISDNRRSVEDELMFSKFWAKPIVKLLMKYYSKSQSTN